MLKTPFTIYYDIETYNQYLKKTKQHELIKNTSHEKLLKPYLCGYILKNNYDEKFSKKSQTFTGTNCIEKMLLNLIFTENPYINEIIQNNFNKPIEQNPDLSKFDINICHLFNKKVNDIPVKNHCYYSGKMLGYAHNDCNLKYKFKKDNINGDYIINIFAHNSQNFDQSFLIKALQNLDNKIPYPYDYFDNIKKYKENKLPIKSEFFNKINNKNISNEDYNHANNVFNIFKCNNLLDYSILHLKTDLCHLADVFQKFSNFAYEKYELDCRDSFTLPGYSWECMLKMTKIELELISGSYIFIFNGHNKGRNDSL